MELHKEVLKQAYDELVVHLDPRELLDHLFQASVFSFEITRNIQELNVTSQKNQQILNKIFTLDKVAYICFKNCLRKSHQEHIANKLSELESQVQKSRMKPAKPYSQQADFQQDMDQRLTDRVLNEICKCIGTEVRALGLHLGLNIIDIQRIQINKQGCVQSQVWEILLLWRQNQYQQQPPTVRTLVEKLRSLDPSCVYVNWLAITERFGPFLNTENMETNKSSSLSSVCSIDSTITQPSSVTIGNIHGNDSTVSYPLAVAMSQKMSNLKIDERSNDPCGRPSSIESGSNDSLADIDQLDARPPTSVQSIKATLHTISRDDSSYRKTLEEAFYNGCFYDGRLLKLANVHIDALKKLLHGKKQGTFGIVQYSEKPVPGLEIPVILKETKCCTDDNKPRTVSNELLASRIRHFAIVPLLAFGKDTQKFYYLYPYLENGDLAAAILAAHESIVKVGTLPMHWNLQTALRILYQIACAIDYLHNKVCLNMYKNGVIHNDISSKNIVLDGVWNARLTGFGYAREINEHKSENVDSKDLNSTQDKKNDYNKFGAVVRELLTFLPQTITIEYKDRILKTYKEKVQNVMADDFSIEFFMAKRLDGLSQACVFCIIEVFVWWDDGKISECAKKVLTISTKCLEKDNKNGVFFESEVVDVLRDLPRGCGGHVWEYWQDSSLKDKCMICMVNKQVDGMPCKRKCATEIQVCTACMRDSDINPIWCISCKEILTGVIGYKWGALLIAGSDMNNKKVAQVFRDDVEKLRSVMISRCPLIMGISEDNVAKVLPPTELTPSKDTAAEVIATDQREGVLQKLENAFENLNKKDLETVIVYYSGHHCKKKGFLLGNTSEYLKDKALSDLLCSLTCKKIIIILDCCEPESVLQGSSFNCEKIIIQINACTLNENTNVAKASMFTKYFIQCILGKSPTAPCSKALTDKCQICEEFSSPDGFITLQNVLEYVEKHIKNQYGNQPALFTHNVKSIDTKIAYFTFTEIIYTFTYENNKPQSIPLRDILAGDMKELHFRLLEVIIKDLRPSLLSSLHDFSDIIRITVTKESTEELDTKEKLYRAWIGKQDFIVTFRNVQYIDTLQRVAIFNKPPKERWTWMKNEAGYDTVGVTWSQIKELEFTPLHNDIQEVAEISKYNQNDNYQLEIVSPCEAFYCMQLKKVH